MWRFGYSNNLVDKFIRSHFGLRRGWWVQLKLITSIANSEGDNHIGRISLDRRSSEFDFSKFG